MKKNFLNKRWFLRIIAIVMVFVTLHTWTKYVSTEDPFPFHIIIPFLFIMPLGVLASKRMMGRFDFEETAYMVSTNISYLLIVLLRKKKYTPTSASITAIALAIFSLLAMLFHTYEIRMGGYVGSLMLRGFIASAVVVVLMWIFSEEPIDEDEKDEDEYNEYEDREPSPSPRSGYN